MVALKEVSEPTAEQQTGVSQGTMRQKHVHQLQKTELCKFFLRNACGKGKHCHFAHTLAEIKEKPDLSRTSMCRSFLQTGNCDDPNCSFAHSEKTLRFTSGFYKTKLCRFAKNGRCKHGTACRFAHAEGEVGDQDYEMSQTSTSAGTGTPPLTSDGGNTPPLEGFRRVTSDGVDHFHRVKDFERPNGKGMKSKAAKPHVQSGEAQQQAPPGRHCTTIMITNVPNFLTQGSLISLLEDLSPMMVNNFDFFYCPWEPDENINLGYAIINFLTRTVAAAFEAQWADKPLIPTMHGTRGLRIIPAALQGRAANLRHFSGFPLSQHPDPRFRPLVRGGPEQPLRPMATCHEVAAYDQAAPAAHKTSQRQQRNQKQEQQMMPMQIQLLPQHQLPQHQEKPQPSQRQLQELQLQRELDLMRQERTRLTAEAAAMELGWHQQAALEQMSRNMKAGLPNGVPYSPDGAFDMRMCPDGLPSDVFAYGGPWGA